MHLSFEITINVIILMFRLKEEFINDVLKHYERFISLKILIQEWEGWGEEEFLNRIVSQ